jgi:hypothetical protein
MSDLFALSVESLYSLVAGGRVDHLTTPPLTKDLE